MNVKRMLNGGGVGVCEKKSLYLRYYFKSNKIKHLNYETVIFNNVCHIDYGSGICTDK